MSQQHLEAIGYAAQAILARRDHSEAEVTMKLTAKSYAAADIAATIAKLKKLHLLNDAEFARRYTASLLAAKPLGPRLLQAKLRSKGIAMPIIEEVLQRTYAPGREEDLARAAAARWRRSHGAPQSQADRARLARHLTARGFSLTALHAAVSGF